MKNSGIILGICVALALLLANLGMCADLKEVSVEEVRSPILARAVMCDSIVDYEPANEAVVFSVNSGKISCFTSFKDVSFDTFTIHRWYRRDVLVTTKRLTLKPPSWSTYSSIQLREADKGPWRVEIFDHEERLIKTLRFSVTDRTQVAGISEN